MSEGTHKEKIVIVCPNCRQKLGIPKIGATLQVTCPECRASFEYTDQPRRRKKFKWLRNKVKRHPILFGLIVTAWILIIGNIYANGALSLTNCFFTTGGCIVSWLFVTWLAEKAREEGVKWYYRKWFVLLTLFVFAPVGITLLWAGSKFRKPTKIGLTVIFGLLFAVYIFRPYGEYYSPEDEIVELFTGSVAKTFLKPASQWIKLNLRHEFLSKRHFSRTKIFTPSQIFKMWEQSVILLSAFDKMGNQIGQGSGFVISTKGAVATNFHVIESAHNVSVQFSDGTFCPETSLIAGYPSYDIAILQMKEVRYKLSPVIIGDSDYVEIGEQVVAIGNPQGWQNTLSDGLVSGKRLIDGFELLQMTVPISSGSSGGPLFNMKGEVIGITTIGSQWGAQNLNFAIPINLLKSLIEEQF